MDRLAKMDARRMAHAYIISSPSPAEGLRQASRIAAAAVCAEGGAEPCGVCRACRKVQAGIHPDVTAVRRLGEGGSRKKEIGVEQIRQISADAIILPNEARRKVYIIEEADTMNLPAQNAALKLLEESPAEAMLLLCVSNSERLLPTVRSRCVELALHGADEDGDEDSRKLAGEYLNAVAGGDPAKLYAWCAGNEDMDAAAAFAFLSSAADLSSDMLCGRVPDLGMSRAGLMAVSALIGRCLQYLRANVNIKHIFGLLAVDSISGR